jgi:FKBP-type peptidyl-prolyl cis-trans isomerase
MRKLIPVVLLGMLIVGCGNKAQQTSAVKVQNPTELTQPAATVPAPPPATPPSAVKSTSKDGWVTLTSGLKYKDIKLGTGIEVTSNMRVRVQYKGWLDNGKVFDSSRKLGGHPYSFTVDNDHVIQGWHEGLKGMKVGGTRELTIPPALGYGDEEQLSIPADSTLHFEIELLDAVK